MNSIIKFLSISLNTIGTQVLMFFGISLMAKSQGVEFIGYQSFVFSIASYLLLVVQLGFQIQGLKLLVEGFSFRSLFINFTKVRFVIYSTLSILLIFIFLNPSSANTTNVFGIFVVYALGCFCVVNSEYYLQFKERFFLIGFSRLLAGSVFFLVSVFIYNIEKVAIGEWLSVLPYALFILIPNVFLVFFYKAPLNELNGKKLIVDSLLIKQSVIIAIGALIVQLSYRADKVIISQLLGNYELGLYDTAYKFLNVSLNVAFLLYFVFAKNIKNNNSTYYHKICCLFLICSIIGGFCIYILSPFLIDYFFGSKFYESIGLLKALTIPLCFMVVNIALTSPMNLYSMEKHFLMLVFISMVVNIIVNFILIDNYGLYAAVYAMIASEGVVLLFFILFFHKKLIKVMDESRCTVES